MSAVKYKVGDKVASAVSRLSGPPFGMSGTVVHKSSDDYVVEFDGFTEGHDGHLDDKETNRWFVEDGELARASKEAAAANQEYIVVSGDANTWYVILHKPATEQHVAMTTTEANADKIAKALNEAEGL